MHAMLSHRLCIDGPPGHGRGFCICIACDIKPSSVQAVLDQLSYSTCHTCTGDHLPCLLSGTSSGASPKLNTTLPLAAACGGSNSASPPCCTWPLLAAGASSTAASPAGIAPIHRFPKLEIVCFCQPAHSKTLIEQHLDALPPHSFAAEGGRCVRMALMAWAAACARRAGAQQSSARLLTASGASPCGPHQRLLLRPCRRRRPGTVDAAAGPHTPQSRSLGPHQGLHIPDTLSCKAEHDTRAYGP